MLFRQFGNRKAGITKINSKIIRFNLVIVLCVMVLALNGRELAKTEVYEKSVFDQMAACKLTNEKGVLLEQPLGCYYAVS